MKITSVVLSSVENASSGRVAAFSVIFDGCFVIHNVELVQANENYKIELPFQIDTTLCDCGKENTIDAAYCTKCGVRLNKKLIGNKIAKKRPVVALMTKELKSVLQAAVLKCWTEYRAAGYA